MMVVWESGAGEVFEGSEESLIVFGYIIPEVDGVVYRKRPQTRSCCLGPMESKVKHHGARHVEYRLDVPLSLMLVVGTDS